MRILTVLSASAFAVLTVFPALAQSNISVPGVQPYGTGTNSQVSDYVREAEQAAVADSNANTTYQMDANGFLVPTNGKTAAGAGGSSSSRQQAPLSQKANNPTKQVYKGGQKKNLVPARTHRMYEDTKY